MKKLLFLLFTPLAIFAQEKKHYKLEVPSEGGIIPVNLVLEKDSMNNLSVFAKNADEKLAFDQAYFHDGALHLVSNIFDLEFVIKEEGDNLSGYLSKLQSNLLYRQAQFTGKVGDSTRFVAKTKIAPKPLAKSYQITFVSESSGKESPAKGIFEVNGSKVNGTFLTNTGDYRYLQGNVIGDSLFLSALGSNVNLYKAKIKGDSLVGGEIFNPFAKTSSFSGVKNDSYELPDASKLTYLKEGYDKFDFSFPQEGGEKVSLSDKRFKDKVTVVQILGTWCPNCMDEAKFLKDFKAENSDVEVVGVAFERKADEEYAFPKIRHFKGRFAINYPVVLGGSVEEASEKLPQLNHVMSFPTSIIIDKKGNVRKIHTGFSGPSTGKYYEDYVKEFTELINTLNAE